MVFPIIKTLIVLKRSIFWDTSRVVRSKSTYLSEEHIASILRVEV
jgi:hypothetical protein